LHHLKYPQRVQAISSFFATVFSEKASRLKAQGKHVVRLSIGEPDFKTIGVKLSGSEQR
jgi:aspartate/methionine/tyrosine aminotransferase